MDISIVIPAFNEARRIGHTLDRSREFLRQRDWTYELLVVDDGSTDRTCDEVDARRRDGDDSVTCIRNPGNRGKGFSIRNGVGHASGSVIGFMDADYKTDIAALDQVMLLIEEGCDGVLGDRTMNASNILVQRRRFRQLGTDLFRGMLHRWLGLEEFPDTQCGFKFFRAEVMRDLFARQQVDGYMFDVEILVIATHAGYDLRRIPVDWTNDPDSRFKPVTGMIRNLRELRRIKTSQGRS